MPDIQIIAPAPPMPATAGPAPPAADDWSAFPAVKAAAPAKDAGWDAFPVVDSTAMDMLKSAGSGIVKGVSGLVGLPAAVENITAKGIDKAVQFAGDQFGVQTPRLQGDISYLPTGEQVQGAIERNVTGPLHEPQTTPGRYAETVGEFAPAAMIGGPAGMAGRVAKYAVLPGAASEAAGQFTEGSDLEPYVRAGTALATGGAAQLLSRPATSARLLRQQLPSHVTEPVVQQAESLMNDAAARGITLTWPEALSQVAGRPVLANTQRVVESAPRTRAQMEQFYSNRPGQIANAAQGELDAIAPPMAQPSTIGPAAGRAATSTINDARTAINRASEPFYQRAESVRLSPQDMQKVRAIPGYEEAANAVRSDPQLARYVQGMPEDSVGFLNEVKKLLDQSAKNAARPAAQNPNMQRAAGYAKDAAAVRKAAEDASLDYTTALVIQADGRQRHLEPLLKGPLGKIAKRDITTRNAIDALFPAQPLAGSQNEVRDAVSALAKRSPDTARQLVRAHLEQKLNEAFESAGRGQEAAQFAGATFAKEVAGSPVIDTQRLANLREAVQALPGGQRVWGGFERFLDIARATGTRQPKGSLTAFNEKDLKSLETGSRLAAGAKLVASPGEWWHWAHDAWGHWQAGQNLDGLAHILTDPKAASLFARIAALPRGSTQSQAVAARLATMAIPELTKATKGVPKANQGAR